MSAPARGVRSPPAVHVHPVMHRFPPRMEYREIARLSPGALRIAAATLTAWRPPPRPGEDAADLRGSVGFYPLMGLLVGAVPTLALLLPVQPSARGALALAAWIAATAGTTLAGWARAWEGIAASAEAGDASGGVRLPRPSTAGYAGVAALVVLAIGKFAALAAVPWYAPLVAASLGRWAVAHALRTYAAADPGDPVAPLAGTVPLWTATWMAVALLGALTAVTPDPATTALAVTVGTVLSLAAAAFFVDRVRGVTGPVCAVACEVAEVGALWAFLRWG